MMDSQRSPRCPKCQSDNTNVVGVQLPLEYVNKCFACGYWFDTAADGSEVNLIRFFHAYPDGTYPDGTYLSPFSEWEAKCNSNL
jgi:hypothetical protein